MRVALACQSTDVVRRLPLLPPSDRPKPLQRGTPARDVRSRTGSRTVGSLREGGSARHLRHHLGRQVEHCTPPPLRPPSGRRGPLFEVASARSLRGRTFSRPCGSTGGGRLRSLVLALQLSRLVAAPSTKCSSVAPARLRARAAREAVRTVGRLAICLPESWGIRVALRVGRVRSQGLVSPSP